MARRGNRSATRACNKATCTTVKELAAFVEYDTIYAEYGAVVTLNGPTGHSIYEWEPAPSPPCLKCPNVQYKVDSAGYYEFKLGGLQRRNRVQNQLSSRPAPPQPKCLYAQW
jgi:hypothetical protein